MDFCTRLIDVKVRATTRTIQKSGSDVIDQCDELSRSHVDSSDEFDFLFTKDGKKKGEE